MAFKLIIALAFVTVTSAGVIPGQQIVYQAAPKTIAVAQPVYAKAVESNAPYPKYQFSYAVNDEHTGDVKSQVESRDGDVVQGEYSLNDADGYKRTVQYSADHDHGFNAVVQREPLSYAVKAAAAPITKAAPQIKTVAYKALAPIKSAQVVYATAPTLIKSAPLAYASVPTQSSYVSQSVIKPSPVSYVAVPAQPSYKSQSFVKAVPVAYTAKPAQASYVRQSKVKPVPIAYATSPGLGAYVRHVKPVTSPYRSSYY